ncbi:uncharacterized protein G2W53_001248 [Senna tora]|uniref:Uncharacterized protein n=1 Tax=Senna tora TaxID=362788 RepID=A0A834XFI4_9FABA|nr:uncharacterized protein G2W53_001248 [Senna tora]
MKIEPREEKRTEKGRAIIATNG